MIVLQLGGQTVKIEPIFSSNDVYAIAHQAKTACAICQLPDYMGIELIEKFSLVRVLDSYRTLAYPIHAIYPAHRHPSVVVQTFLGFCQKFLKAA